MLKLLIAVDGSELSLQAVYHALALMRAGLRCTVVLAHVQEPATLYELVTTRDPELIAAASLEAGEHLLEPARVLLDAAGMACDIEVGVGDVAHTLVDMVERLACDMVLVGARGHGDISSALMGSVSRALVQSSPVPVTVVKPMQPVLSAEDLKALEGED